MEHPQNLPLPPISRNTAGAQRRAGFEFEYASLGIPDSAAIIARLFGGKVVEDHRSAYKIVGTKHGDFSVKVDAALMQTFSASAAAERAQLVEDGLLTRAERLVTPLVSSLVPNEIVTPPIAFDALQDMAMLADALRDAGAKGTGASAFYAFGMHINAELPDVPPERLRDYLAAFLLLQERLVLDGRLDATRDISGYTKLFPEDYIDLVVDPDYRPDFATLVGDYLEHNPTRNRALDMLPAFMQLAPEQVAAVILDERVRPRPAFHYRLPNCCVDDPNWSPLDDWALWVSVETLAEDRARLDAMGAAHVS